MKVIKSDLESAAQSGVITKPQADALWAYFESLRPEQGRFQALHVLYYFGGVLILASMSWFLTNAWDNGFFIMAISALFGTLYAWIGQRLWKKTQFKIPGGLLVTAAVGLVPVFVYGLEKATGLWPQGAPGTYHDYHVWVRGSWVYMEVATVFVSLLALRIVRFPFLTFPLAVSLWYLSMDLTPLIFGRDAFSYDERKLVSMIVGLAMLLASWFVDRKFRKTDFAFWTYLFGLMAFWGGLSLMNSHSEWNKLLYCGLNLFLIVTSVYLRRRAFLVFGILGVMGYLGHLAWEVFQDSMAFPVALAILGMGFVYLGIQYQKTKAQFEKRLESLFPSALLKWRPEERS